MTDPTFFLDFPQFSIFALCFKEMIIFAVALYLGVLVYVM